MLTTEGVLVNVLSNLKRSVLENSSVSKRGPSLRGAQLHIICQRRLYMLTLRGSNKEQVQNLSRTAELTFADNLFCKTLQ